MAVFLKLKNLDYLLKLAFQSTHAYQTQLRFIPFQAMLFHMLRIVEACSMPPVA
jgi:hypothetical protein